MDGGRSSSSKGASSGKKTVSMGTFKRPSSASSAKSTGRIGQSSRQSSQLSCQKAYKSTLV